MTAAAATCEDLLEMEGEMLGNRSSLGERQGPWLTYSLTLSLTANSCFRLVRMVQYLGCQGKKAVKDKPHLSRSIILPLEGVVCLTQ